MAEIPRLRRRLTEQMLERAAADPQWRQQFIEDPETATGEFSEARELRELYESGARPTEQLPEATTTMPSPAHLREEYSQLNRSLAEKILDRAATDAHWKQQLLGDPDVAIREADFPEFQQLEEMRQSMRGSQEEGAEVRGQWHEVSPASPACHECVTQKFTCVVRWLSI